MVLTYLAKITRGEHALKASAGRLPQETVVAPRDALAVARLAITDLDNLHSAVHAEVEVRLRIERAAASGMRLAGAVRYDPFSTIDGLKR